MYSRGASEEIVGEVMASHRRRDELLLATKVRMRMGDGPNMDGLSRQHVIEGCEASLRRLRTDHIDLYQVHEWDGSVPLEETLAALDQLVRDGKVRYIGVSNYAGWQLMKALEDLERRRSRPVRLPADLLLAAGALGRVRADPAGDRPGARNARLEPARGRPAVGQVPARRRTRPRARASSRGWDEPPVYDEDRLYDTIEVLVEIGSERGVSAAQVALAWLLTRPTISSVIVGARTDEQLADNLAGAELELSASELERLERVSRPPLLYPYWHQWQTSADRLSPADLTLIGPHGSRRSERERRSGGETTSRRRTHLASSSSCQ